MSFRIFTILFIIVLITSSCSDQITQSEEELLPEETTFIPYSQTDASVTKGKGSSPPSEFGCSLSTLNESNSDQLYRYQAFYIQFPAEIINEANGKVSQQSFTLRSGRAEERTPSFLNKDGVVRYLTCRIPDSPQAVEILEEEMQKFGEQSWYNDLNSSSKAMKSVDNSMSGYEYVCRYEAGDGYGNTMSIIEFEGYTWVTYYFHEVCEYEYVQEEDGEGGSPSDDFGGGGGEIGDPDGPNEDPNPCTSIEDADYLAYDNGEIIGCDGNIPSNDLAIELWESKIDDSELAPCMQDELTQLTTINKGVGKIVQEFAIDELNPDIANFNWKVHDGDLSNDANAQTYDYNATTNTVFTKFDTDKYGQATDLAVARTMLHEAVHAYLVAFFYEDLNIFQKTYADLFQLYLETNDIEQSQHQYMANNFVSQIADALQEFGQINGLNLDYQYYHDLAWGGLTETSFFQNLSTGEKSRIHNNIHAEQYGTDTNGNYQSQKGDSANC